MSFRSGLLVLLSACALALVGCKNQCEQAADVLAEKCGSAAASGDAEGSGEECAADSEILADCVNKNDGKTCAEIQAACYAP